MKPKLFPKESFDKNSIETINKLIEIATKILDNLKINPPSSIEFYNSLNLFIKRVLPQVIDYGLTESQAIEFIKSSLNSGTYGTFDIKNNTIIEMNFNPYFKIFYPSTHFLKLLIHESLHLFLYSQIKRDIYKDKFKFENGKYAGYKEIIQLDEGFATLLTDKILEDFDFDSIKELPIYSELNEPPKYKENVEGLDISEFNHQFNIIYEKNSKKGYELIEKKFNQFEGNLREKIDKLVTYIANKIKDLSEHKLITQP